MGVDELAPQDGQPPDRPPKSRARAVARLTTGMTSIYLGGASLVAALIADVFGLVEPVVQVAQFGAAALIWTGSIILASGVPHLARYGSLRGVLALLSFATAGVVGLVAVAEMFESFFLETTRLAGFDEWALAVATVLVVVGIVLLGREQVSTSEPEHPEADA